MAALYRAMEHLAGLDGNFQTEGATASCYEDGANSCSAAQLSEFALMLAEDSPDRERYTEAARRILEKHASHEQALVPDCGRHAALLGGAIRCGDGRHAFGAPCPNDEFAPRLVGLEYLWPVPPV